MNLAIFAEKGSTPAEYERDFKRILAIVSEVRTEINEAVKPYGFSFFEDMSGCFMMIGHGRIIWTTPGWWKTGEVAISIEAADPGDTSKDTHSSVPFVCGPDMEDNLLRFTAILIAEAEKAEGEHLAKK